VSRSLGTGSTRVNLEWVCVSLDGGNGIREGRAGARQIGKVDRKEPYADMTDRDEQGPWEGRLTHASFEFGLCCRELDDSNPYSAEPGIPPALVQVMGHLATELWGSTLQPG
jgi:hypothetical protein